MFGVDFENRIPAFEVLRSNNVHLEAVTPHSIHERSKQRIQIRA